MNKLIAKTLIASGVALSALSPVYAAEQNQSTPNSAREATTPPHGTTDPTKNRSGMNRDSSNTNRDSSGSVGQYVDDATITAKVKAKHAEDDRVSAMGVEVDTVKGVVTLTGEAKTQAEIQRAEVLAKQVEGVKSVSNMIELKPKS